MEETDEKFLITWVRGYESCTAKIREPVPSHLLQLLPYSWVTLTLTQPHGKMDLGSEGFIFLFIIAIHHFKRLVDVERGDMCWVIDCTQ